MSQSLSKALRILTELSEGGRSLDELAHAIQVHKSTVLRLLRSLEAERFARRDSQQRWHLGSRLFELGSASLEQHTVRETALPHMRHLSRESGGHAVHLAAHESGRVVYIAKIESTASVRMYSRVGLPAAPHATAVGKILTAALPAGERESVISGVDFYAFTKQTITDAASYRTILDDVRQRGWATDRAEHEDFINCVAAPVRDGLDRVIAAVSISAPDVIADYDTVRGMVPILLDTTEAIGRDWREG